MMDESKKMNAGKYRNKQRYKNKTKVVQKDSVSQKSEENTDDKIIIDHDHIFQKRTLESNWYRYEPKEGSDKDTSRDFKVLASAPIAQASYFQFKSDKNITNVSDLKQIDNKLFWLDVNLLDLSISIIPFHIRCGIDEKYFSKEQIHYFIEDARDNIATYRQYIETNIENKQSGLKNIPKKELYSREVPIDSKDTQKVKNSRSLESHELEEWLDDILDD